MESIWDYVYSVYRFQPYNENGKRIKPPGKFSKFDLSSFFGENFVEEYYNDLNEKTIEAFQMITQLNDIMYAFSWQHDCYSFNPYLEFEIDEFEEWLIPVFPNGDFNFFLSEDFSSLIYSDGVEQSIYVCGERLLSAFEENLPTMFATPN